VSLPEGTGDETAPMLLAGTAFSNEIPAQDTRLLKKALEASMPKNWPRPFLENPFDFFSLS
jgi:hypothetical protein